MSRPGGKVGARVRNRPGRSAPGELALYVGAGVAYTVLGVLFPALLFSWPVGAGFLLGCVVVLPALLRRIHR